MPEYAQTLTYLFSLGIVALQAGVLGIVLYRLIYKEWVPKESRAVVQRFGLALAAALPVAALFLSLWYSDVVGIPVCPLCWFARTLMYPLAIILPIAAWRRDLGIVPYALTLSAVGAVITGYHHLYQMGLAPTGACDLLAGGGDCATRYVFEFGYVTMPLMGFTLFVVIGLILWITASAHSEKQH